MAPKYLGDFLLGGKIHYQPQAKFVLDLNVKVNLQTPGIRWESWESNHFQWSVDTRKMFLTEVGGDFKYLPWKAKCLAQALAGKLLLRKFGLPGTIYLGIKKDSGKLEAHAWLICGSQFISGKEGHKKFTVVQEIS